jgi:hypothetical protein
LPHRSCGFGSPEGCSLDFLFRFASRQNEKQAGRHVKNIKQFYSTIIALTTDWHYTLKLIDKYERFE